MTGARTRSDAQMILPTIAAALALLTVARLLLLKHKQEVGDLPFIADITHGICPRCGEGRCRLCASAVSIFWREFSCTRCGFAARTHLSDDA